MKVKAFALILILIHTCGWCLYAQQQPDELPGLRLWLKADGGVVLNGNYVSQWSDFSGNNNHATSDFDVIRPTLMADAINGLPAISFDGIEDFLQFPEIADVRTIFWVLRENIGATGAPPRPLLGWSGGLNYLRGGNEQFWEGQFSSPAVFNGSTRLNFSGINGVQTVVPNDFSIVSLVTAFNVQASHLTMEWNIYGRTWWGEIAEIIIYNQALTLQQIEQIELYLANKYSPTFAAIEDVQVSEGFCDTTVCAPSGFLAYQWSNGSTTQCTDIDSSGTYSLTMIDEFGRELRDTVDVIFPGNLEITSTTICSGEQFSWNTALEANLYSITLNGEVISPTISIGSAGDYELIIVDQTNCSLTKTFSLAVDSFPDLPLLGDDETLCSGNFIESILPAEDITSFEWNTGFTGSQLVVTESGEYSLEAINMNSCHNSDTIIVTISGIAPDVAISIGNACDDASTAFSATPIGASIVTQWNWNFGDGNSAVGMDVFHEYNNPGVYDVVLIAIGQGGCQTILEQELTVHSKPAVSFSTSLLCEGLMVSFSDNSTTADGTLVSYSWLIANNFLSGPLVEVIIPISGFNSVVLTVQNSVGCSAELIALVDVKSPPQVDWNSESVCLGSLTSFTSVVNDIQFPINSYQWEFGDGTFSQLQHPNHYYPLAGIYDVKLTATNSFGCSAAQTAALQIYALPTADFLIINACVGQQFNFVDQSQSSVGDIITGWSWKIADNVILSEQSPYFIFNSTGLTSVELTVVTQNGCQNITEQQIPVWPVPQAEFSFDPLIGEAPVEIHFTNLSENSAESKWFFGDTFSSDMQNAAHTFTLNGTFYVQLLVTNQYGCSDTIGKIITIAEPLLDVRVNSVTFVNTDNGTEISCELINMGNITIEELVLSWQVGNDAPVKEVHSVFLMPGASYIYTFNSLMQQVGNQYPYLCVSAQSVENIHHEVNFTDNSICKPLRSGELEVFPPFPNPGDDRMFIRFITPVAGDLSLKVYDSNGKLVMELTDMDVPEGFHQYFMDISALQNGNYVLHLALGSRESSVAFMKLKQ